MLADNEMNEMGERPFDTQSRVAGDPEGGASTEKSTLKVSELSRCDSCTRASENLV